MKPQYLFLLCINNSLNICRMLQIFFFVFAIGNCDFEIDKCSWSDVHTDDFDWLSGSGTTTSSSTGPRTDHTTGNATGKIYLIQERRLMYTMYIII